MLILEMAIFYFHFLSHVLYVDGLPRADLQRPSKIIQNSRNARESQFDELQKEQSKRVNQSNSKVDSQKREKKLKEMKEFKEEREKLMKLHEEKMVEMKSKHWKEETEFEEGFNAELTQLYERWNFLLKMVVDFLNCDATNMYLLL